jgi:hypothetical protein
MNLLSLIYNIICNIKYLFYVIELAYIVHIKIEYGIMFITTAFFLDCKTQFTTKRLFFKSNFLAFDS